MIIRPTGNEDLEAISVIHEKAFGQNDEAILTQALLNDTSAMPRISLIAIADKKPAGHILFTKAGIPHIDKNISASILAPLAVIPEFQGTGVGGKLVQKGLQQLRENATDLVFVLGHPDYYPRFGFKPAGVHNLLAPYPIPPQHAEAWMVLALKDNVLDTISGQITCADTLNKIEYWVE